MSATPLSDAITQLNERDTWENYAHVLDELLRSKLGVIAVGLPAGVSPGTDIVADGSISCALVPDPRHPDAPKLLLACAEAAVFRTRFDQGFNAEVDAAAVMAIVIANRACGGVLVNSAVSKHSAVVDRATIERLRRGDLPADVARPARRPWWKRW
jgi:hypothetical protein